VFSLANHSTQANRDPRVLLVDSGRWPTAARLAIELSKAGANVSILCPSRHPGLKTRAVARAFHFGSLHPLDSLQSAIEAARPAIVLPCDDRSVLFLHELHTRASMLGKGEIAALITRSLGPADSFTTVASRFRLLKVAREEGVRVAETHAIDNPSDFEHWNQTQRFPWVMKVDGTTGGRGVEFVQAQDEAQQFLLKAHSLYRTTRIVKRLIVNRDSFLLRAWWRRVRPTVVVQGYIQGHPANCAVMCWEGRILAGISVDAVSADGATGPASVVRVVDNAEMMLAAERIARRLNLSGMFGLDFMVEEGSGDAYLIEMNPRCTPLCHLRLGKGRDMIGALISQLCGVPLQEAPPVTNNDLIAYFPQAWTSKSEFLQSSFQDAPWDQPELTQELLHPWPDRSFLYTAYQLIWTRLFQPRSPLEGLASKPASKRI